MDMPVLAQEGEQVVRRSGPNTSPGANGSSKAAA